MSKRDNVTLKQWDILRHSLGLSERRAREYRNYFVAGGDDETTCRELVALGLMVEGVSSELTGGAPVFYVTDDGKKVAHS